MFAGINSSSAELRRGNNQHFRSFKVDYPSISNESTAKNEVSSSSEEKSLPPEKENSTLPSTAGKISLLSQESLFLSKNEDTYQRITRLSPWRGTGSPRIGAIASGMAQTGEIVLFRVTLPSPSHSEDVIGRINLGSGAEAEDVDIRYLEGGKFRVAYTDGDEVFACDVSFEKRSDTPPEIRRVYASPQPDKSRLRSPKFRALRFVSSTTLLLLQNAPQRSGCVLLLVQLPPIDKPGNGIIIQRKRLPRTMKIGLGLDVCDLGEDDSKGRQWIVAVSGSDHSIPVFTLESAPTTNREHITLQPYTVLKDVHPVNMTKICFSTFHPPAHSSNDNAGPGPQRVKLASVSMGNTVAVHTFYLTPYPPLSQTPRYVLSLPGESSTRDVFYRIMMILAFVVAAFALILGIAQYRDIVPHYNTIIRGHQSVAELSTSVHPPPLSTSTSTLYTTATSSSESDPIHPWSELDESELSQQQLEDTGYGSTAEGEPSKLGEVFVEEVNVDNGETVRSQTE